MCAMNELTWSISFKLFFFCCRKRGRPKGSKTKPKPPPEEALLNADGIPYYPEPPKKKRGRPLGSKNKIKPEAIDQEAATSSGMLMPGYDSPGMLGSPQQTYNEAGNLVTVPFIGRGRGRPKGSKTKPKPPLLDDQGNPILDEDGNPVLESKRERRGRPKGSKNKSKTGGGLPGETPQSMGLGAEDAEGVSSGDFRAQLGQLSGVGGLGSPLSDEPFSLPMASLPSPVPDPSMQLFSSEGMAMSQPLSMPLSPQAETLTLPEPLHSLSYPTMAASASMF